MSTFQIPYLLIDDVRELGANVIVRNAFDGLNMLRQLKGQIQVLGMDHDLMTFDGMTGKEFNGYDLMKIAAKEGLLPDEVQLVTDNVVGLGHMQSLLHDEGYTSKDKRNWKRARED